MLFNRKGFTLMELIVVITIIGVLAAIAFPFMTASIRSARMTEAKAGLAAIRTAERLYRAGHTGYLNVTSAEMASDGTALNEYIKNTDLAGQYFSAYDYKVQDASATVCNIVCTGNSTSTNAPSAADVNGYTINMDVNGTISNN